MALNTPAALGQMMRLVDQQRVFPSVTKKRRSCALGRTLAIIAENTSQRATGQSKLKRTNTKPLHAPFMSAIAIVVLFAIICSIAHSIRS
jgi:L-asparagine transporter-like permease